MLGNPKASVLKDNLQCLGDFVNGLGGVPTARTDLGIKGGGATGLEQDWTKPQAEKSLEKQKEYLEFCGGGGALLIVEEPNIVPSFVDFMM